MMSIAGCEPAVHLDSEEAGAVLAEAIEALTEQPARWESVAEDLIDRLAGAEPEIQGYVEDAYYGMIAQSTGEFACRLDFDGSWLRGQLQEFGHFYWPHRFSRPVLAPAVCAVDPGGALGVDTTIVTYFGYDLRKFAGEADFQASLLYGDTGEVVLEPAGVITVGEDYTLRLDIGGPEVAAAMVGMDPKREPLLALKWGGDPVHADTGLHALLPLSLPSVARPHEVVDVLGPFGEARGEWYAEAMCPDGTWVTGASVRIQASLGGEGDDSSLNGIRLACANTWDPGRVTEISSGTGFWGEWESAGECEAGYATSARMRIQAAEGAVDDTGAVDVAFGCSAGELSGNTHHPWGEWTETATCPKGAAICGLQTRIEAPLGEGDDVGMTDAKFLCCRVF